MTTSMLLLSFGILTITGFAVGQGIKRLHLPSILGCMLLGCIAGPSILGLITDELVESGNIVTDVTLGFVALSIGLELRKKALKKLGPSIIPIIFSESLTAFGMTFAAVYLLTRDLPMSLIFAAMAPASAPAGTVAVIQETKSKGTLTTALYAVVGFDDGLAVLMFAFASSVARTLLLREAHSTSVGVLEALGTPMLEIALSLGIGLLAGWLLSNILLRLEGNGEMFVVMVGTIFIVTGFAPLAHASLILANLVVGLFLANSIGPVLIQRLSGQMETLMALLFVVFFCLAGAHLNVTALPAIGSIGVVYVIARVAGLISGAWLGALIGGAEDKIRKYLGLGILSQAGVAIGLSLIVNHDLHELGTEHAAAIGTLVLTSIAATSIIFEFIGPVCARIALERAGEVGQRRHS